MSDDELLNQLNEAQRVNNQIPGGPACQVCEALAQLRPDVAEAVQTSVVSRTIGRDKLAQILTDRGYPVGRRHIDKHRTKEHPIP